MAYLGNSLSVQQYAPQVAYFSGNGSTTAFTLPVSVVSAAQIIVVVANVVQNPSSAFTVSGTTLTFTSAPPSGTNNIWVEYTSLQTNTIAPSAGTVNTAQLGTITNIQSGNSALTLQTGSTPTTAVTIDTSQNVGIGTTPSAWASGDTVIQIKAGTGNGSIWGRNGTLRIGNNFYYDGTNYKYTNSTYAPMNYEIDSGSFTWNYAPVGTAGNNVTFSEAMRIDSSGNLLVGTTNASDSSGAGFKLLPSGGTTPELSIVGSSTSDGAGSFTLYSTGSGAYKFYVSYAGTIHATSTTITAISDQRLKENIRDLDVGLNQILAIKPRRFDWIAGKGLDKKDDVGFIAQEFETVFPNSVTNSLAGEDGVEYKAVSQSELIPTLVKAIQEQQALITTLQTQVTALKAKVGV